MEKLNKKELVISILGVVMGVVGALIAGVGFGTAVKALAINAEKAELEDMVEALAVANVKIGQAIDDLRRGGGTTKA